MKAFAMKLVWSSSIPVCTGESMVGSPMLVRSNGVSFSSRVSVRWVSGHMCGLFSLFVFGLYGFVMIWALSLC